MPKSTPAGGAPTQAAPEAADHPGPPAAIPAARSLAGGARSAHASGHAAAGTAAGNRGSAARRSASARPMGPAASSRAAASPSPPRARWPASAAGSGVRAAGGVLLDEPGPPERRRVPRSEGLSGDAEALGTLGSGSGRLRGAASADVGAWSAEGAQWRGTRVERWRPRAARPAAPVVAGLDCSQARPERAAPRATPGPRPHAPRAPSACGRRCGPRPPGWRWARRRGAPGPRPRGARPSRGACALGRPTRLAGARGPARRARAPAALAQARGRDGG